MIQRKGKTFAARIVFFLTRRSFGRDAPYEPSPPKAVWVNSMWYSQEELTIYQGQLEATLKELQSLKNMQQDAIAAYKVRSRVEGL